MEVVLAFVIIVLVEVAPAVGILDGGLVAADCVLLELYATRTVACVHVDINVGVRVCILLEDSSDLLLQTLEVLLGSSIPRIRTRIILSCSCPCTLRHLVSVIAYHSTPTVADHSVLLST
jgi:hypothetical protein